tara:strand:- start:2917 stop:4998 length:2082 start_codon:yes stop_codon:yes gene_type:complete
MAGFAKNVTTPIDIPSVQSPDFNQNTSTAQDVVGLLGFGLQLHQQQKARKAEESRQVLVGEGLSIANELTEIQGQVSNEKLFRIANQKNRALGGGPVAQAQRGSIIAQQFGFQSTGQALLSESEKNANNLEQEYNGLGDSGEAGLIALFPGSTFTELNSSDKERVVEEGLRQKLNSDKIQAQLQSDEDAMQEGNMNTLGSWFKEDKDRSNQIDGVFVNLYAKQLNLAAKQGITLVAEDLLQMKESVVSMLQAQKFSLLDRFSEDQLLKLDNKDATRARAARDSRADYYDERVKFVNEMEVDEFNNFADTTKLLKEKDGLELMRSLPDLQKFKTVFGPQAMNTLVSETLAKKPEFRKALADATLKGFEMTGITKQDSFAVGLGIVAGIGEGRSITDYDSDDQNQSANIYWKTTQEFINNEGMIDNSTPEGVTSMAIAAVQVLEFAEERGTVEDKERALKTINSPEFRKLYEKSPPDIREAMGRKVIQYNRDTFENNAQRLIKDLGGTGLGSDVSYNADKGKFEIKFSHTSTDFSGTPRESFVQRQERGKVAALNKQLEVVKLYAKDDPFLNSLSEKEQRDFIVRTAGLPAKNVKGSLAEISQEQEEASRQGITIEELRAKTDIVETTKKAAGVFADVERQIQDSNLPPELVSKAIDSARKTLSGDSSDEDILTIMRENPSLTFAEAEKLAKGQQ